MAKKIKKGFRKALSGLLTVLGITSIITACSGTEDGPVMYGPPAPEYGVPGNIYVVEGTVTGAENKPVEGIQVGVVNKDYSAEYSSPDSYYRVSETTDENGNYKLEWWANRDDIEFKIEAVDIDGEENGSYSDKTVEVKFTDENRTGTSMNGPYEDVNYKIENNDISLESSESLK